MLGYDIDASSRVLLLERLNAVGGGEIVGAINETPESRRLEVISYVSLIQFGL